jgi:hypothetical protein
MPKRKSFEQRFDDRVMRERMMRVCTFWGWNYLQLLACKFLTSILRKKLTLIHNYFSPFQGAE